jgi:cytochrome c
MTFRLLVVPMIALVTLFGAGAGGTTAGQGTAADREAEALLARSGCLDCHHTETKVVGPAFRDVAARYRGVANARAALAAKVAKGGRGNWNDTTGGARMPPHSALLSEVEIAQLVDWVLRR